MSQTRLSWGELTHVGQVRARNEDHMGLRPAEADEEVSLFVVADGMGGHSAGHVASQMAVESTIGRFFETTEGETPERLQQAVETANRQIHASAQANAEYHRMGTTLVGVAIHGNQAVIASVGDSRVYVVRKDEIKQITRDHSWVALQVELGELTLEEARTSMNRSVLLRCLGEKSSVNVDLMALRLRVGDRLILCSDGLHGLVADDEIRGAVSQAEPQQACDDLVALANARGGTDNITVQVVRVDACPEAPSDESDDLAIQPLARVDLLDDDEEEETPPHPTLAVFPSDLGADPPSLADVPYPLKGSSAFTVGAVLLAFGLGILMVVATRLTADPSAIPPDVLVTPRPLESLSQSVATAAPLQPASPGVDSAVPSSHVAEGFSSPLPAASEGPLATPSALPSASVSEAAAVGSATLEGTVVTEREAPIVSPAVRGETLFWLEDGALWRLEPGDAAAVPVKVDRMSLKGRRWNAIGIASDTILLTPRGHAGIFRLDAALVGEKARLLQTTSAPVRMMASDAGALAWVEEGSREIRLRAPLNGEKVRTVEGDGVTGLAVSLDGRFAWTNGAQIFVEQLAPLQADGRVTHLAASATHLYWTVATADGENEVLHRRSFDAKPRVETLGPLLGPVSALTVGDDAVYWVVSGASRFSLRRLSQR